MSRIHLLLAPLVRCVGEGRFKVDKYLWWSNVTACAPLLKRWWNLHIQTFQTLVFFEILDFRFLAPHRFHFFSIFVSWGYRFRLLLPTILTPDVSMDGGIHCGDRFRMRLLWRHQLPVKNWVSWSFVLECVLALDYLRERCFALWVKGLLNLGLDTLGLALLQWRLFSRVRLDVLVHMGLFAVKVTSGRLTQHMVFPGGRFSDGCVIVKTKWFNRYFPLVVFLLYLLLQICQWYFPKLMSDFYIIFFLLGVDGHWVAGFLIVWRRLLLLGLTMRTTVTLWLKSGSNLWLYNCWGLNELYWIWLRQEITYSGSQTACWGAGGWSQQFLFASQRTSERNYS